MGYYSNLIVTIMEMHHDGDSAEDIASTLNIDVLDVTEILKEYNDGNYDCDPGDMDGDHATGLASAGFGTDEDYGYYGDE